MKTLHWSEPGDGSEYDNRVRASSLIEDMRNLETINRAVHQRNHLNYQLYSNRSLAQFDWGTGYYTRASLESVSSTTDNGIVEVIDGVTAEVGKSRPKAKVICHGASFTDRQNARKLDKFLWGEFCRNKIYELGKSVLLNAEVCDFGVVKVCCEETKQGSKIKLESIFPDEILINQNEVIATGEVRSVYRRRVLPVEVVADMYDVSEADLKTIPTAYLDYREVGKGYVVVGEVHRQDGRHVVAVDNMLLVDEEWDHCWLPYVFFHYFRPSFGFYSQSLVELILPDQIRLNEINEVIEEAQRLFCSGKLLVAEGSRVTTASLDNAAGRIIKYTGTPPTAVTWPAISPELYNERERTKAGMFAKAGLNQAAAGGALPEQARLDSSAAIRELNSVRNSRLSDVIQRYEQFFMDIATTMVRVLNSEGDGATTVWYPMGNKGIPEKIEWKSINLEDNSYTMMLEPASSFSMTPSAIRDDLENKLLRGEITPTQYQEQLTQYDPDSILTILAASELAISRDMEKLEAGEAILPDRNLDLVNALTRAYALYNVLHTYEESDELTAAKLATINYIESAKSFTNMAAEPSPEQEMAPPTQQMGMV